MGWIRVGAALRDVVGTKGALLVSLVGPILLEKDGDRQSRGELATEFTGGVAKGMVVGVHEVTGLERGCRLAVGVGVPLPAILFLFMGLSGFLPALVDLQKSGCGFEGD
ncbi:hypothetical protein MTP99_017233 [Tenebrio molitor]|nr:hypothetical protein MTP99_017233 [Tenebrio molitor]